MIKYGPRVLDAEAYAAQQADEVATAGGKYGTRVMEDVSATPPAPAAPPAEADGPTVAPDTIAKLGAAIAADPAHVHAYTVLELEREGGPRKGALHALRAVAEARQAEDAEAAGLVAILDEALAAGGF